MNRYLGPQMILGVLTGVIFGCGARDVPTQTAVETTIVDSAALIVPQEGFQVEVVATNLEVPWDIEPAPDGRIFITERPGRIRILDPSQLDPNAYPVVLPDLLVEQEGGLLDLVFDPEYEDNRWVYLSYTPQREGTVFTRISRFTDSGSGFVDEQILFEAPLVQSEWVHHLGCRMIFGPDGKLYFTLGERGEGDRSQDLGDVLGKTLRINKDGSIPSDNPFVGVAGARPEIFSLGNRNAQGMTIQPGTGLIFQAEHGPSYYDGRGGGDEINIIEAGHNYGWPLVSHNRNRPGLVAPLIQFTPATAPGGAAFYDGDLFPEWQGNLFITNLRGKSLQRVVLSGREIVKVETLLSRTYGRFRAISQGPDGALYLATSNRDQYGRPRANDDQILRLIPE